MEAAIAANSTPGKTPLKAEVADALGIGHWRSVQVRTNHGTNNGQLAQL